jgi:hypothetical protein
MQCSGSHTVSTCSFLLQVGIDNRLPQSPFLSLVGAVVEHKQLHTQKNNRWLRH